MKQNACLIGSWSIQLLWNKRKSTNLTRVLMPFFSLSKRCSRKNVACSKTEAKSKIILTDELLASNAVLIRMPSFHAVIGTRIVIPLSLSLSIPSCVCVCVCVVYVSACELNAESESLNDAKLSRITKAKCSFFAHSVSHKSHVNAENPCDRRHRNSISTHYTLWLGVSVNVCTPLFCCRSLFLQLAREK